MRYISIITLAIGLCAAFRAAGAESSSTEALLPAPSTLKPQAGLPDPLVMFDGRPVTTRDQWFKERRPELQALFQHYMYGAIPPKPAQTEVKVVGEYHDFLGGKATLKLVTLEMGATNAPWIDLMLVVPNERTGPAPVFLAIEVPEPATWALLVLGITALFGHRRLRHPSL